MDNTAEVQINLVSTDNASGNILAAGDALDTLNQKTIKTTENSGQKITELGGKFKQFKEVSGNAISTAIQTGAINSQLGSIGQAAGGVVSAFGTLLQTGFNPLSLAITGVGLMIPVLISSFSSFKPSLENLSKTFDDLKKSISDTNSSLFSTQDNLRNIRNSGLEGYLQGVTEQYKEIEKINQAAKDAAKKNSKEIANEYIKSFDSIRIQSGKVFEAFNISDDQKNSLEDFKKILSLAGTESTIFAETSKKAITDYGGTVKAVFRSNEILDYFQKSALAGRGFQDSFDRIANKVLGLNEEQMASFKKAGTEQNKFYEDLKKQTEIFYNQKKVMDDKDAERDRTLAIEKATQQKADMQKYLTQTTDYYQKRLDNYNINTEAENIISFKKYADALNAQGEFNQTEINLMKISSARKKELLEIENKERMTAIQDAEMNMIKMKGGLQQNEEPEQQIQSPLAGDDATGAIVADQAAAAKETEEYWKEAFTNMGAPLKGLMTDMSVAGEAGKAMGAVGGAGAKSLSKALVQLGASGKLSLASVGAAMKQALASELQAISMRAMLNGMMETAIGIAALTPYGAAVFGPAPGHFASAGMFFAAGAATGVAAGVIGGGGSTSASGGTNVADTSKTDTSKTDTSSETKTEATTKTTEININVSGNMNKGATEDVLEAMQNLGEIINSRDLSGASAA